MGKKTEMYIKKDEKSENQPPKQPHVWNKDAVEFTPQSALTVQDPEEPAEAETKAAEPTQAPVLSLNDPPLSVPPKQTAPRTWANIALQKQVQEPVKVKENSPEKRVTSPIQMSSPPQQNPPISRQQNPPISRVVQPPKQVTKDPPAPVQKNGPTTSYANFHLAQNQSIVPSDQDYQCLPERS